jgi:N-glycosylase/DNA lyase
VTGAVSRAPAPGWSSWVVLPLSGPLDPAVLAETLDGGQAFRWRHEDGIWLGIFGQNIVRLSLDAGGVLSWSAPAPLGASTGPAFAHYFDAARDPRELADALPWRSDVHLAACLASFPGLRILRQPFGETLLGFLCSATKQIVQIKQMLALLAERHGSVIAADLPTIASATAGRHGTALLSDRSPIASRLSPAASRLPTWSELALIPEAELRACQFGFRARFIHQTARFLAAHPGWLEATETLPYAEAKERLCSLPGVGEKIADCVLLFGAGRLEAFPVDTWILKAMAARYGLHGWKPASVAQFGRAHFGALAGLAQQYLFSWERKHGGGDKR